MGSIDIERHPQSERGGCFYSKFILKGSHLAGFFISHNAKGIFEMATNTQFTFQNKDDFAWFLTVVENTYGSNAKWLCQKAWENIRGEMRDKPAAQHIYNLVQAEDWWNIELLA